MPGTLITGATGFVGSRLVARIANAGAPPLCLVREAAGRSGRGVRTSGALEADLSRPEQVRRVVESAAPDRIFHLGAMADPRACERDPDAAMAVNAGGTQAVLEGAAAVGARVLVVSSAAVYGVGGEALDERLPPRPTSAYGRSKLAAERAAETAAARGLQVVIARPFNHSGPGQTTRYVLPALAAEVLRALADERPVDTGNLFPRRDFLHVDDVLDAYELLLDEGESGAVYNVCRGQGLSIGEALAGLQRRLGAVGQRTRSDPSRTRSDDIEAVVGDPSRLRALGWEPRISLEELLDVVAAEAVRAAESL
jgi:GDP-4-dehydro-6-deoxy-D-mannose reductase